MDIFNPAGNPIDLFLQGVMGWIYTLMWVFMLISIAWFVIRMLCEAFALGLDEPTRPAPVTPAPQRHVLPAKPVAVPDIYEQMAADDPVILRAERAIARADAAIAGAPWPGFITVVDHEPITCEPGKVELETFPEGVIESHEAHTCSEPSSDNGGSASE